MVVGAASDPIAHHYGMPVPLHPAEFDRVTHGSELSRDRLRNRVALEGHGVGQPLVVEPRVVYRLTSVEPEIAA